MSIGEVVQLYRVVLCIEVDDCVRADARFEDEIVVAGSADRHRHGLVHRPSGVLRVGDADIVRLRQGLAGG